MDLPILYLENGHFEVGKYDCNGKVGEIVGWKKIKSTVTNNLQDIITCTRFNYMYKVCAILVRKKQPVNPTDEHGVCPLFSLNMDDEMYQKHNTIFKQRRKVAEILTEDLKRKK